MKRCGYSFFVFQKSDVILLLLIKFTDIKVSSDILQEWTKESMSARYIGKNTKMSR